jgi:SAM-dependent methyltransferase
MPERALALHREPAPRCRLCGSLDARPLFSKESIPYHRCGACDFVFSSPESNANLATEMADYEPVYRAYLESAAEDDANFERMRRWIERHRRLAGARVLDVGAGSGKWVRWLRARGADAIGIEPSPAAYGAFLAGEPGFSCEDLAGFAAHDEPERFDVITAFDVLEHVEDAGAALGDAARLLAPGGFLFVSTPDVATWPARLLGKRWHFYNRYHLSYWSRRTLVDTAGRHGLALVSSLFPLRWHSTGYLLRYLTEFVLRTHAPAVPASWDRWLVPVWVPDGMQVCFEKRG